MKRERAEQLIIELIEFLQTEQGKILVAASQGKLPVQEVKQLLDEEKDIVLYIIMLRRILEESE